MCAFYQTSLTAPSAGATTQGGSSSRPAVATGAEEKAQPSQEDGEIDEEDEGDPV